MKDFDYIERILELIGKRLQLSRRDFFKATALFSSGLLVCSTGSFALSGCHRESEWECTSFPKVLLHNFQLFDGLHNRLQQNLILLIEGDKIRGIEREGDLDQYRDCKTVDLKGRTILPGLIDNHVHITSPFMLGNSNEMDQQIEYNFRNCVMSGVTTVRDVGAFPGKISEFKIILSALYNCAQTFQSFICFYPISKHGFNRFGDLIDFFEITIMSGQPPR